MTTQKEKTLAEQLPLIGVTQWRDELGITGKNIGVWNIEADDGHGACTGQVIRDVAPNVDLHFGTISVTTKNNTMTSIGVQGLGERYQGEEGIENFIVDNNIKIISSSQTGQKNKAQNYIDMWKRLQAKYNLIIFNCAGNECDNEAHETVSTKLPEEVSIIIGALGVMHYRTGTVVERQSYSSVGQELDFMQLVLWYSGTSAATPCMAGMAAMILERYGYMSYQEMYKYLQMIAEDMGEEGDDVYYGNGWCKLPEPTKKYITMTTKDKTYRINGHAYSMDTTPVNINGNVFVPIRVIAEALNGKVNWKFNSDKSINIQIDKGNTHIELNTGDTLALINGKKVYLNEAPFIDENNRTLVPIRFVAEGLNCHVDWFQKEAKVMILEK